MSEQVGSEAYSGVVRCDLLHGSRHRRFRAGEEREPLSEAWEARNKTLRASRTKTTRTEVDPDSREFASGLTPGSSQSGAIGAVSIAHVMARFLVQIFLSSVLSFRQCHIPER